MKLTEAGEGAKLLIARIEGGLGMRRRLGQMGIFEGAQVEMVRSGMGPVIIRAAGAKLAIGRGQAMRIEVETV